jgi:hypothetical protein
MDKISENKKYNIKIRDETSESIFFWVTNVLAGIPTFIILITVYIPILPFIIAVFRDMGG